MRTRLGYADYLGALQRYRSENPHDLGLLAVSRFLINYPFANRLFPKSLDVIEHVKQWGPAVLLTDGDVVFQPRKVDRSGLYEAVDGHALIYVHKEHELADVEARYPADHYVMVDDKLRILAAIKKSGAARVTTVFVRQGHYARDARALAIYRPADKSIERIGDLLNCSLQELNPALDTRLSAVPRRARRTTGGGKANRARPSRDGLLPSSARASAVRRKESARCPVRA